MNRHSPDPFYQQDTGFREQVVQVFSTESSYIIFLIFYPCSILATILPNINRYILFNYIFSENIMSSKRRQRPESDHQSEKPATQENRLFRAAWRSSWSGNTHIVVQRRPFSTIAGIFLVLYMTAFVFFRFHNTGG